MAAIIKKKAPVKAAPSKTQSLRDKYKATKIDVLKNKIDEENKSLQADRTGYHEIAVGSNKFRIYPKHEGEETFYLTRCVHWLTVTNDDGDEVRKTVFNSRIHGGTDRDIIEEYVKGSKRYLAERAKDEDDPDLEASDKIKALTDWKAGLNMQTTWLMYADKITKEGSEFNFLEVKKTVRDEMNRISNTEDSTEVIEIEPFTDPDDGYPIIITYDDKEKKAANKYHAVLGKKPLPLTEEQLIAYDSVKPLEEIFRNCYRTRDFDLACEGLQNYDEEHEIGYFESDEFQELIEEMKGLYETDTSSDSNKRDKKKKNSKSSKDKPAKKTQKPSKVDEADDEEDDEPEADDEEEGIDLSTMDRSELKALIKEQGLDITVMKSMSDDAIRDLIEAALTPEEAEEEADDEEEEAEEETQEVDLDSMDRSELKAFIKEQELDVKVLKSMSDDDLREAIANSMAGTEDEEEDTPPPPPKKASEKKAVEKPAAGKKAPASLDDIKDKIKARLGKK